MQKKQKTFWYSFMLTGVIGFCLLMGAFLAFRAYENILQLGFGIYQKAIELTENGLRIFDFYLFS